MSGQFVLKKISEINLEDSFFDSLKKDYPQFEGWFQKKASEDRTALVFEDNIGVGAFIALKNENEEISNHVPVCAYAYLCCRLQHIKRG